MLYTDKSFSRDQTMLYKIQLSKDPTILYMTNFSTDQKIFTIMLSRRPSRILHYRYHTLFYTEVFFFFQDQTIVFETRLR